MGSMGGWDDVSAEIESKQVSSEELMEVADALRSDSEGENLDSGPCSDVDSEAPESRPWWAECLHQHSKEHFKPPLQVPISLLSGCSGACSEGAVLKARSRLWLWRMVLYGHCRL